MIRQPLKPSIRFRRRETRRSNPCALIATRRLGEIGLEKAILRSTGEQWYPKIGSGPYVAADTKG